MTATRYRRWGWLAIVSVLCAGLLVALGSSHSTARAANDPTDDAIVVTGVGVATGTPDTLTVDFGVHARRTTVQTALDDMTTFSNKLISALKDDGVKAENITTNGLSLYQWHNRKTGEEGYVARQTVEARVTPLDNAGQVISDGATSSGHVDIDGMFFNISDDDALMQQARKNAFDDAKDRATQYAQLAGRSVGRVERVNESVDGGEVVYDQGFASAGAASAPVPISPGTQQVTINVTVTYQMT
jgi:uncharacterized protein YggE